VTPWQVHQARLLMELEAGAPLDGPPGLLQEAAALWGTTVRRVHISEFHADVAAQLRVMGVPCVLPNLVLNFEFLSFGTYELNPEFHADIAAQCAPWASGEYCPTYPSGF